ncbi:MAG: hypothetical protein QM706_14790 [Nitrospira sp.]
MTDYTNHTVFGRFYRSTEDKGWTFGPNTQVPYNNGESINNKDLVFWYEGYLPHSADEGSDLWHSTGIRLVVNGGTTQVFTNPATISIPDSGGGIPNPSTISVTGLSGVISKVTVKLNGLNHTYPDDLDILLVGPGGQKILLMSDAGGGSDALSVNLLFDSAATASLPDATQISSGIYRPTNYGTTDPFSAPAPAAPYGTNFSVFHGTSPNGTWQLFVNDDEPKDLGSIASGWELTITTN